MVIENRQKAHYQRIHDAYGAHYYDSTSLDYRRRFIFSEIAKRVDFSGLRIADLACGEGYNSVLLRERFPSASPEGFDISPAACIAYQRVVGSAAHQADLTQKIKPPGTFQGAIVIGGLHHCVANLPMALSNLAAFVEVGGKVVLVEPNINFIGQFARDFWYRRDRYFEAETERALDPAQLLAATHGAFREVATRYFGGPAYFFILNSLVTRVPLSIKRLAAPPLFWIETAWNVLPGKRPFPAFLSIWERI